MKAITLVALLLGSQVTLMPGHVERIGVDQTATNSVTVTIGENLYFAYEPKPDITAYELARLLPYFSGVSYGQGAYSAPQGSVMPYVGSQRGGRPVGETVLSLDEYRVKELGSAMRHLRALK